VAAGTPVPAAAAPVQAKPAVVPAVQPPAATKPVSIVEGCNTRSSNSNSSSSSSRPGFDCCRCMVACR
jgi:hypothetical protein